MSVTWLGKPCVRVHQIKQGAFVFILIGSLKTGVLAEGGMGN